MSFRLRVLAGFFLCAGLLVAAALLAVPPLLGTIQNLNKNMLSIGPELAHLSAMKTLAMAMHLAGENGDRQTLHEKRDIFLSHLDTYSKLAVDEDEKEYPRRIMAGMQGVGDSAVFSAGKLYDLLELIDDAITEEFHEMEEVQEESRLVSKQVEMRTAWILGLGVAFSVGLALWLAGSLTSPVNELLAGMGRVGEQTSRALPDLGRNEFGELGRHYNHMLERLRQTTVRKDEMEQIVRDKTADLIRTQQSREAMAQILVHDLSNVLFGLKGEMHLIQSRVSGQPGLTAGAGEALKEMEGMIGDILSIYRMERGLLKVQAECFDAAPLFFETCGNFWRACETKRLGLHCLPEQNTSLSVCTDRRLLNRILQNLLRNAIRYAPENSDIEVNWSRTAHGLSLSVRDHGAGIPQAFRERIFDAYVQLEPGSQNSAGGLGLGLSFCRMATGALQGHIRVEDAGPGAKFVVELPDIVVGATQVG